MAKASKPAKEAVATGPKPIGTVFNTLQFIALGALIGAIALLWLALSDYGFQLTAK